MRRNKKQDTANRIAERLDHAVEEALQAAVAREGKVESLFDRWRNVREANNFRLSLDELFRGD